MAIITVDSGKPGVRRKRMPHTLSVNGLSSLSMDTEICSLADYSGPSWDFTSLSVIGWSLKIEGRLAKQSGS